MKLSATGPPTVTWKWPTIHIVLCTSTSIEYDELTTPPAPPKIKSSMPSAAPLKAGLPQGSQRTVATKPRRPARRAASSKDAKTANAVINEGTTTP